MFSRVFSYEGLVWRVLDLLTDIFALSLLWFVCSLPIFTMGAATTALYDSVVRCLRFRQPKPYQRFFTTFRRELGLSSLCTLLWAAIAFLGLLMLYSLRQLSLWSDSAAVAAAAYYMVLVLPVGACCWVFPLLSRFTFAFKALNLNALRFAIGHLPSTVILVLLTMEILSLSLRYLFPLAFSPVLLMLLWSLFIEPVFKKHGGGLTKDGTEVEENSQEP